MSGWIARAICTRAVMWTRAKKSRWRGKQRQSAASLQCSGCICIGMSFAEFFRISLFESSSFEESGGGACRESVPMGGAIVAIATVLGGVFIPLAPISVSLSPTSPQAIDQGLSVAITATLTNDAVGSSKGVTWEPEWSGISLSSTTGLSITYKSPTTTTLTTTAGDGHCCFRSRPDETRLLAVTVNPGLSMVAGLANGTVRNAI